MNKEQFWVYILHCENDTYYTGYTNDLGKRYASHVDGTARCKYTRSFKPLYIAQCWRIIGTKALAMDVERSIKKLVRSEKERIIRDPSSFSVDEHIQPIDVEFLKALNSGIIE